DRGGRYKAPAPRSKELLSVRARHRQQQSARSLRIVEQVSDILRDTVGEFDALRNEFDVRLRPPGRWPWREPSRAPGKNSMRWWSRTMLTWLAAAISRAWPRSPKPVMSVAA